MRTPLSTAPSDGPPCPSSKLCARRPSAWPRRGSEALASEAGMTLIEVLIASVMVAIIAVGTFTAFDAAGQSTADERAHAQATLLVQQDQERLRGFTTTTLEQLGTVETYRAENGQCLEKSGSSYLYFKGTTTLFCEKVTGFAGTTYKGTVFTVTSSSNYVSAEKGSEKAAFTCEKSGGSANYLQTKSSVAWPLLKGSTVSQSSVLNVPSTYVLEVKVVNQNKEAVEGATVSVTGGPSASTPSSGCVVFGGLSSGPYEISANRSGWVDQQGKSPPAALTGITLTSGSVTEEEFIIAEPSTLNVEFESNGVATGIESNSFYALNTAMKSPSDFVEQSATPVSKLTFNKVFPFKSSAYTVFAGECESNNPATLTASTEKLKDKSVPEPAPPMTPGATYNVKVEAPAVNVEVFEGTKASAGSKVSSPEYAYITNAACKGAAAQNQTTITYQHKVGLSAGALETKYKYQPFAKELVLCVTTQAVVVGKSPEKKYYRNTFKIENLKKAGTGTYKFYLQETANTEDSGKEESTTAGKLKCP